MASSLSITSFLFLIGACVSVAAPVNDHNHSVAFSAGLTYAQHVAYRNTVVFNKVFANIGNGYNHNTGIFTCTLPGLYVFHIHAYDSNKDVVMWLELLHNDNFIVSISGYNSHSSGGNTVLLQLNRGDRVQVNARDHQEFTLFGLDDQVYSTFTGYLLSPSPGIMHDSGVGIQG